MTSLKQQTNKVVFCQPVWNTIPGTELHHQDISIALIRGFCCATVKHRLHLQEWCVLVFTCECAAGCECVFERVLYTHWTFVSLTWRDILCMLEPEITHPFNLKAPSFLIQLLGRTWALLFCKGFPIRPTVPWEELYGCEPGRCEMISLHGVSWEEAEGL